MSKRQDFVLLGRRIGTYDGWDEIDTMIFTYYSVIPIPELHEALGTGPSHWTVDFDKGTIEQYNDDEGPRHAPIDLLTALTKAPKVGP